MSRKKIIVTDLDDTLIKSHSSATEAVVKCWNEIIAENKAIVVIATGQLFPKVTEVLTENLLLEPNYVIANQGTDIFNMKTGERQIYARLPNDIGMDAVRKFLELGGEKDFVRVCTSELIVEYDCEVARKSLIKTSPKNILLIKDLERFLENGDYAKLVLLGTVDVADKMVSYFKGKSKLFAINSGTSSYGQRGYYRFELTSSDKEAALIKLLESLESELGNGIDILCLGDEQSDLCLAHFALSLNSAFNSSGQFSVIKKDSDGNRQLIELVMKMAKDFGCPDKVRIEARVEDEGWVSAVKEWINK